MTVTRGEIESFINELDLPEDEKHKLLVLTPADYTGIAEVLAKTDTSD